MEKEKMKLLSLFDGSGAFCLAAGRLGIEARYASEIEPFPIAVTRARFPGMEHLGDITKINGGKIEPCELVTFGSPCTDISIAGRGGGLAAARSGLFFQAIRVMREMMEATGGEYPRAFIFENVPNLLSINKGNDWKTVMDEFTELGFICDPNLLDSQEFKIAQRRKRIFVLGINRKYYKPDYFTDIPNNRAKRMQKAVKAWGGETFHGITSRPHEIRRQHLSEILERDVDPKYYLSIAACLGILRRIDAKLKEIPRLLRSALEFQAEIFNPGKNSDSSGCTTVADRSLLEESMDDGTCSFEPGATARLPKGKHWSGIAPTLRAESGDNAVSVAFEAGSMIRRNGGVWDDISPTLRAEAHGGDNQPGVAFSVENYPKDGRVKLDESGTVQTLTSHMGTGGNSTPLCAEPVAYGISSMASNAMCSPSPHSGIYETDTAKTLDTSTQSPSNQGGLVVCMEGNGQRPSHKGSGVSEDGTAYSLNTVERHCVSYAMTTGSYAQALENKAPTLQARDFKSAPIITRPPEYIVRKLTPTECLVLMNLPRDWCEGIAVENPTELDYRFWKGVFAALGKKKSQKQIDRFLAKPYSDSACYKMAGNGVVVCVAQWVMEGFVDYARHMDRESDCR